MVHFIQSVLRKSTFMMGVPLGNHSENKAIMEKFVDEAETV